MFFDYLLTEGTCLLCIFHDVLDSDFLGILGTEIIPIDLSHVKESKNFLFLFFLLHHFDLFFDFFACEQFSLPFDKLIKLGVCQSFLAIGCLKSCFNLLSLSCIICNNLLLLLLHFLLLESTDFNGLLAFVTRCDGQR